MKMKKKSGGMGGGGGGSGGCVKRMEVIVKRNKIKETKRYRHMSRVGGRVWGRVGEAFVKIQKKKFFFLGGGGCERRSEAFERIKKKKKKCLGVGGGMVKMLGGGWVGSWWLGRVRVDMNGALTVFLFFFGGGSLIRCWGGGR